MPACCSTGNLISCCSGQCSEVFRSSSNPIQLSYPMIIQIHLNFHSKFSSQMCVHMIRLRNLAGRSFTDMTTIPKWRATKWGHISTCKFIKRMQLDSTAIQYRIDIFLAANSIQVAMVDDCLPGLGLFEGPLASV